VRARDARAYVCVCVCVCVCFCLLHTVVPRSSCGGVATYYVLRAHTNDVITSSCTGQRLNWGRDLRSVTSCLRSTTSNNRSCTSQLRSGTFLLWDPPLRTVYIILIIFSLCMMFYFFKCSLSRSFCHLHSMLVVDSCRKRQTLFKCHKSQIECLECSKTPGRRSGTPPLLSALRARASAPQTSHL